MVPLVSSLACQQSAIIFSFRQFKSTFHDTNLTKFVLNYNKCVLNSVISSGFRDIDTCFQALFIRFIFSAMGVWTQKPEILSYKFTLYLSSRIEAWYLVLFGGVGNTFIHLKTKCSGHFTRILSLRFFYEKAILEYFTQLKTLHMQ